MSLSRPPFAISYISLSLLLAAQVEAQPDSGAEQQVEKLIITGSRQDAQSYKVLSASTATGLELAPKDTPQSIAVVTTTRMQEQNLTTVIDVINQVTGLYSRPMDNDRFSITARGMSVRGMLYDGVPVSYDTRFNYGDNLIDTAIYQRIEVVRGATGLMTGAGDPSAAVNLIRKRPTEAFRAATQLSLGTWQNQRAMLDLSGSLNQQQSLRGRAVVSYSDRESFQDRYSQQKSTIYGIAEYDLGEHTLLTMGGDFQRTSPQGTMSGGLPLFYRDGSRTDYGVSASTAPTWGSAMTRSANFFVSLEHVFANNWKLKADYGRGDNRLEFDVLWATGFPDKADNQGMRAGSIAFIDGERKQDNYSLKLTGDYQWLGREHQLVVGWNSQDQNYSNPYYLPVDAVPLLGDFTAPGWDFAKPVWQHSAAYGSYGNTKQQGSYALTRLTLTDNLALIGGLRFNRWQTDQDNFGRVQDYAEEQLSHYAGITYDVLETVSLYASFTDIFSPQNNLDASGRSLDPVVGQNFEIGAKASLFDDLLDVSVALFEIQQDNVAKAVVGQSLPGNIQVYRGVDGTKTTGYEIELNGALTQNWRLSFGYSEFSSEDPAGQDINTATPGRQLQLFSTFHFSGTLEGLQLGGGLTYQGDVYRNTTGPQGEVEVRQGGYSLINLMAGYQLTEALALQLNVQNLLDKRYYAQLGQFSQFQYGAPRSLNLSLNYQF